MTANKPEFAPLGAWKVSTAVVEEHAEKRNVPAPEFPKKATPVAAAPETAERPVKFGGLDISRDLSRRIRQRALDEDCTTRALLLKALEHYGIEVSPQEMVDDGRRRESEGIGGEALAQNPHRASAQDMGHAFRLRNLHRPQSHRRQSQPRCGHVQSPAIGP